jgi:hypothetical protein
VETPGGRLEVWPSGFALVVAMDGLGRDVASHRSLQSRPDQEPGELLAPGLFPSPSALRAHP